MLYVHAMVSSLALLPSPLLGPSVWQPVAQVHADRGWHTMICAASAPLTHTGPDVLDAFLAALSMDRELVLVPHSNDLWDTPDRWQEHQTGPVPTVTPIPRRPARDKAR